jgi:uncharacterized protein YndB with AHSA1/START domain
MADADDTTLRLVRRIPAARDRVFRAWTDPEVIRRWWVPFEGYSVPAAEVDLRVGGSYRLTMRSAKGEVFSLVGTYREVRPPHRLVYTWEWEGGPDGETVVTVEFRDLGEATEVVLTHAGFPGPPARDRHREGWNGVLDRLAAAL